jgi:hypothetical protein
MMALILVLLLAAAGLAIDVGNAFSQRRHANNAVDAAALAATRILVDENTKTSARSGTPILNEIEAILDEHRLPGANLTWDAVYVPRASTENFSASPDDDLGPVTASSPPRNGSRPAANGIRVNATYTVDTFFMRILGQRELAVTARGTGLYAPIGSTIGRELAPLAISVFAFDTIVKTRRSFHVDLQSGWIREEQDRQLLDPTFTFNNIVRPADFAHVSFYNSNLTPQQTGSTACAAYNPPPANPPNSLYFWWCNGSVNRIDIKLIVPVIWGKDVSTSTQRRDLENVIRSRTSSTLIRDSNNRPILLLPVFSNANGNEVEINNFVAVAVRDPVDSERGIELEWLPDYVTAGGLVGQGSGVDTGVYAVNLVR